MHICLIGPSYPFRGGVAHHTTLLYRHLRQTHRVTFYAFKRQYPRWLFPGRTDRDPSEHPLRDIGVENILDSIDPLTWWDVYRRIKKAAPDLVIIPWWTSFWAPQFWTIATLLKRFSSARILFICHNILDHEFHAYSRLCARAVLSKGDYFFVHSESDGRQLREILPSAKIIRAFHPLYDVFADGTLPKTEARAKLGLHGDTILAFGFVRRYKGLDDLLDAMPLILKRRKITLLVAGEFWDAKEHFARRLKELGISDAVRIVDRYIPNEEVGLYFSAADLVVLPYLSGTGSGVLQLAFGLEKPVVATRVGSLLQTVEDGRTGYLVDPGDPTAVADAVVRFFEEGKETEFVEHIRRRNALFSWKNLVALIDTLLEHTSAAPTNTRSTTLVPPRPKTQYLQ